MKYLLLALTVFSFQFLSAQTFVISGTVQDKVEKATFPGATVMVTNPADTSLLKGGVTDFNGQFRIADLVSGNYLVKVNFVGFKTLYRSVELKSNIDLGVLDLEEDTKVLSAVEVVGKPVAAMQKGDTTQFSAGAYKTAPDASSQDLIEKLPGISNMDGKLQANGEDVQVILVDGKPFFGGDVSAALQNLPAEVIASVQIFDKKSDKAALSGFDDGNQQKTINIITKPSRKVGQFGKTTVGYGTDDTYQVATSINFFNDDQRITVTGLSNNTNLVSYSADPNDLGDARTQNGLIKTNNFGINFSDDIGEKLEVHGNYQFSHQQNQESNELLRDYALASDSGQVYSEDRNYDKTNARHVIGMKLQYEPNENNTFIFRPNASFRHEETLDQFQGQTVSLDAPINATDNKSDAFKKDYDYNSNLYYGRKFDKKGRSLTTRLHTGWHWNEDESNRFATNTFYDSEDSVSIIDQLTNRLRTGFSWETQLSYTEPLGKRGLVEVEYQIGDRINDSDQLTYDVNEEGNYLNIDTALSNTFENNYLTQELELGYQYRFEKLRLQMEAEYQREQLKNDQEFPLELRQNRVFRSWLPSARVDYRINENKRLLVNYRTSTNEPSTSNLQNVIDQSNPLQLRVGNPNLNQSYNHRVRARFWSNDMDSGKSIYVNVEGNLTQDHITNSTFIATEETEVMDGVVLEPGSQLIKPANVDGYYRFRTYTSYGQPIETLKSNIRLNGVFNMIRKPGQINDQINYSNYKNYWLGISLSSNISENLDFNVSSWSSYNTVKNSLSPNLNNNYYTQSTSLKYRWVFWDGIVYRVDLKHQMNSGLSAGYDNSYTLLNMSAGKKFLKNDLAEISINVYDLLQQNNNARRSVTELYLEDKQSTVLQRYFMLTFTYNIRHFNAGTTIEDFDEI
ncbi:MAG: outer membrane beta-barrel protein [Cyclobacteriaceae bacterium]